MNMTSEQYFDTLAAVKSFPTIPETIRKLDEALQDPETAMEHVAKIIMQDPVLTAKLVKIANSSYFGQREKISSIQKAISILGLTLIKQLTLNTSILSSFTGTKKNVNRQPFWQHSAGVAVCAKLLSKDFGVSVNQQDELFTIGLLHDIGKVVTEQYFPAEYNAIVNLADSEKLFYWEAEQKVLGLTHAETGRWVTKLWNFDLKISNVIGYHHSVEAGFEFISEREKLFLAIINLSDTIIKDLKYGYSGDAKMVEVHPLVVEFLNLTKDQLKSYIGILKEKLTDIDDFLMAHF
jgi:putative nucleotidyltransferase with HDIG domain